MCVPVRLVGGCLLLNEVAQTTFFKRSTSSSKVKDGAHELNGSAGFGSIGGIARRQ